VKIIIAIDDTDNLESRGTGFRARQLALSLEDLGYAEVLSITRHQLLVDKRIPYTSHNSSASILVNSFVDIKSIIDLSALYLKEESAEGSDAGLCVAEFDCVSEEIICWGNRAKKEVLTLKKAHLLAEKEGLFLEGYKGKKIGVIGALAAIGLRKEACDGRLLWLRNLREANGIYTVSDYKTLIGLDAITRKNGIFVPGNEKIFIGEWCRPVHINKKITLIADKAYGNKSYQWRCASKEYIKSISE
jgi:hypothetical protein